MKIYLSIYFENIQYALTVKKVIRALLKISTMMHLSSLLEFCKGDILQNSVFVMYVSDVFNTGIEISHESRKGISTEISNLIFEELRNIFLCGASWFLVYMYSTYEKKFPCTE